VRFLLDTHALVWWLANDPGFRPEAREALLEGRSFVAVSAASAWELSIKSAAGKLSAPEDLPAQLERHRFVHLPMTIAHALLAGSLPPHHNDPFDRMLVAQAQLEDLTIVTRDPRIAAYDIPTLAA
jgi:PIN domain nuclease of toxin-antitoxin system